MYLPGILCLVAVAAALPVLPDPPTLPHSAAAAHEDSKIQTHIHNAATTSAPTKDKKDSEKVKKDMLKTASMAFPPPPQLPPYDYSMLKKQKENQKPKYRVFVKPKAENSKKEKESVIPEKPLKIEVLANPDTLSDSKTGFQDSEVHASSPIVTSDSAPLADKKDNETEHNMVKIPSILIPSPPELPLFDFSILKKQTADKKEKFNDTPKQPAKKFKKEKEVVILVPEKSVQVEMSPNPATLINPVTMPQDSEAPAITTDSAPVADKNDDEEVKHNKVKIATVVIPPPPELPPFDYFNLRKKKSDKKPKSESTTQATEKLKNKEVTILDLEKPVKVKVSPTPATLPIVTAPQESDIKANILGVATDSTPADKKDNEKVNYNIIKIATVNKPPPPELAPYDYSILRKQKIEHNLKSEYSEKQAPKKPNEEKEMVILGPEKSVQVEVPPNPATLINPVTVPQEAGARAIILSVITDSAPVADNNEDEEVKHNKVKIATVVIPPPPELPPFDYSNLRKQKSDKNPKSESMTQAAEKLKKTEVTILDLEKPIPATLPIVTAPQESYIKANILGIATDSTSADKKDNEKVKYNINKIASANKPTPPELAPFDYSILKSEYSAKQAAKKPNEDIEMVILDLEKPVKVEELPNPATDSIAALPVSELRMNILNVATDAAAMDKKNNEEVKTNIGKIALDVIPPPPELPLLDFSNLQKHKSEQKQKSTEKDKEVLIIEKPVEIKIEEPKLIEDSKPVVESKPVEESKPKEEVKKEPVKHSEDIPVVIKWTIPTAPILSKSISNYPPLPSLGLNWASQRPSKSRPPRIIYS